MPNCNVELKCKYGIGNACRFNILVDGVKYSKNFTCDTDPNFVLQDATGACNSGIIDVLWDKGWVVECSKIPAKFKVTEDLSRKRLK